MPSVSRGAIAGDAEITPADMPRPGEYLARIRVVRSSAARGLGTTSGMLMTLSKDVLGSRGSRGSLCLLPNRSRKLHLFFLGTGWGDVGRGESGRGDISCGNTEVEVMRIAGYMIIGNGIVMFV
jgi:hypothetical protein